MQGHLKININLFSALCPPQLHKNFKGMLTGSASAKLNFDHDENKKIPVFYLSPKVAYPKRL